jgi:hypothetical protein
MAPLAKADCLPIREAYAPLAKVEDHCLYHAAAALKIKAREVSPGLVGRAAVTLCLSTARQSVR